ncbi:hypothetical protein OAV21_01180 [bacterium]|nr:hypothetical protein [Verrucomicrobiales bacterium]MDC3254994.1 hypothetical protein [bacterium]MDB2346381.1 hypothetical protein [Verrucomicrobiales bacterium]MDC0312601.1 hypothetical protein [Verrucomicrobiales bacterium]MDC0504066.1 hypothetical protein [Verrucomicrobiales bacterium]
MFAALAFRIHRFQQSRLAYVLSFLLLTLQRSPVITYLAKFQQMLGKPIVQVARVGVPLVAYIGGTHAVTGATGVIPAGGSANPAEAVVGESFVWVFRATGNDVHANSYSVNGLPAGMEKSQQILNGGVSSFAGVPEEVGTFAVEIIAWRRENQRGTRTPAYELTLNVVPGDPPTIAAQPEGGVFDLGANVRLRVTAEGHGLHYRWHRDDEKISSTVKAWIDDNTARRVLVPTEDLGRSWRSDLEFDDSAWLSGSGGIGYERSADDILAPFIGIDVESEAFNKRTSTMVRIPFELSEDDLDRLNDLKLRVQYDDGFIAFLNGSSVASVNAPSSLFLSWNSKATDSHGDAAAVEFVEIDLSEHVDSLKIGPNLLAIQALNESANSSGYLLNVELLGGRNVDSPVLELTDLTEADAGGYTVEVSNSSGSLVSETAEIAISGSGASGYIAWLERHWPDTPNIEATAEAQDPDADGLINLFEYYYDSNPLKADSSAAPTAVMKHIGKGKQIVVRFPSGVATDYAPIYEISNDLQADTWQVLENGIDGVEIESSDLKSIIRLPVNETSRYIRLRLQLSQ